MERNFFVKAHGLGNDYIVLDQSGLDFGLSPEKIRLICDYHFGIGSDGILLKAPSSCADFGLRIFNPDGSEAEKSGNGLRIFAKYLRDYGFAAQNRFTVETPGGIAGCHIVEEQNARARTIEVEMGRCTFKCPEIPVVFSKEECFGETLRIDDREYGIHCVSVGNPHCTILKDTLDESEIKRYGTLIENHPMFPNRINVQFAKIISRTEVQVLIWERGAGYTLASGSSSSAVAAVTVKKGLTDRNVLVSMPGGTLKIEVDEDFGIRMTGEVKEIASGSLSPELIGY
jgi:diaminopimelate epimerase